MHYSTIFALHHLQIVHALRPRMDIAFRLIAAMFRYFGSSVANFMTSETHRCTYIQCFIDHAHGACISDEPDPSNANLCDLIWCLLQWQTSQMPTASLRNLRWPAQWAQNPLLSSALRGQPTFDFNPLTFRQILFEMNELRQLLIFHDNILANLINDIPDQDMATIPWELCEYINLSHSQA